MTLKIVTASLTYLKIMKTSPPKEGAFDQRGGFLILVYLNNCLRGWISMHLSLERLVTTVLLLFLALSITPNLFITNTLSSQPGYVTAGEVLSIIQSVWAIDIIVISLSVDHTSLSLSVIPFVCILPVALMICVADYQAFMSVVGLALLTIIFVIARYIANSM
nr:hypothetical protein [Candidatus Njordarchaeum guaymaensis]